MENKRLHEKSVKSNKHICIRCSIYKSQRVFKKSQNKHNFVENKKKTATYNNNNKNVVSSMYSSHLFEILQM